MNIEFSTIDDVKALRPDLFQELKQEVILGGMRLTKDDILNIIDPLAESIKEFLKPYLPKITTMTYNDIVDMENDIVDEVSEQLQDAFIELEEIVGNGPRTTKRKTKRVAAAAPRIKAAAPEQSKDDVCKLDLTTATIDDLKAHRPDLCGLLYDEFVKAYSLEKPKKKAKVKEEVESDAYEVKLGDVLRWNYTKEEGIVVGFDSAKGKRRFIVEQYDGTRMTFENSPKLFSVLEGSEKEEVIEKRERFVAEAEDHGTVL